MKPSLINGLLLGLFLLFVIVYWNVRSSAMPQESAASVMPADHPPLQPAGSIADVSIEALKERVEQAPTDTTLLNHLAQVLHDAGRYEEAASYYKQFLEYSPENIQGWLDLANVYAALEDWEKALAASASLLEFAPRNPSAMYNMGAIHANAANLEEATYWWTQVRDQQEDQNLSRQAAQNLQQLQLPSL